MSDWGTRTSVDIAVGTIDLRVAGPPDGEPVVLLHGFPQTSRSWGGVVPHLVEQGLRVVAPDQRGYSPGARPVGTEAYATATLADDVAEVADALGLDTFHLVGHDWGASIAWLVAARHADRLRTLTAVSVPHLGAFGSALQTSTDQRERSGYIRLFRQAGKAEQVLLDDGARRLVGMYEGRVPDDDVTAYVELLREPGALTAALEYYRAMRADLASTPPTTVPTTFVWSSGDRALGREGAERCGDLVSAPYRFVELDGVSHWIPDEAPQALAAAIAERIGGHRIT